jgi:hypothetical protein
MDGDALALEKAKTIFQNIGKNSKSSHIMWHAQVLSESHTQHYLSLLKSYLFGKEEGSVPRKS